VTRKVGVPECFSCAAHLNRKNIMSLWETFNQAIEIIDSLW
jgi:hypothetical protein